MRELRIIITVIVNFYTVNRNPAITDIMGSAGLCMLTVTLCESSISLERGIS